MTQNTQRNDEAKPEEIHDVANVPAAYLADEVEATIYHKVAADPDEDEDLFETTCDLGMGYDFATDHGVDPEGDFDELYEQAGTVDVDRIRAEETVEANDDVDFAEAVRSAAYNLWELEGEGHDPATTRSMAVGDIIEVAGRYFFVDSFGYEEVDVEQ